MIEPIEKLAHHLSRLPGIGAKTAQRLAYAIISMNQSEVHALADSLIQAKEKIHFCPVCGHYTEHDPCSICGDPKRNGQLLCVVRDPRDVFAMEKTHEYRGKYHVLQGVLSPMNGVGPENIRIRELLERVQADDVAEVVLATGSDVEGEATSSYIAKLLKDHGVMVSRIAHGVPVGSSLEHIDEVTLARAFSHRREM